MTSSRNHTETFGYDALNRLTSGVAAALPGGNLPSYYNLTLSYDRYGNMTCVLNGSTQGLCPQLSYSTNPYNNRITSSGYTYDAAGNMTDDGTHSYQWDAEGRLISVDNGSTESNTYNALGEEVESDSSTYGYVEQVFDASGETLGEYESSGWNNNGVPYWWPRWFRIGSQIVAFNVCCPEQTGFVYGDALQSAHEVTDYTGNELMDRLLYPWGQSWEMWGTFENQIFAGLDSADGETGFYGAMFRQYNSTIGRWMSPDPADLAAVDLTNPQSLNRYAYALNSPTSLIDPSGLGPFAPIDPGCIGEDDAGFPWDICTGLAGGVPLPIIPVIIGGGGGTGGSGGGTGGGGGGGGQNGDTGSTGSSPPSGCEQLPSGVWCPSGGGFPVWTIYAAGGGLFIAVYATITMQAPANPAPRHCLWCVLAHRPWMVSWVIPLVPLPELGVGPAGSVAYNPDTGTVCASFGLGAGAGHNLAFGPLTNGIVFNSTSPFPAGADQILRGVSTSFGGNAIPLGFQAVANGAGGAIGPTLGIPGYTLSVTVSGCAVAR